jgi:aminoglycoside phosphotransferase (APT) family kinase protein
MTDLKDEDAFRRLVQRIEPDAGLRRVWPLTGGVSAQVTAVEIGRARGETTRLIVRRHGEVDRARNARIARDEYRLLRIVRAHGVAAPKPYHLDESCDLFPTPIVVVEYVDGETEFAPSDLAAYLSRMAAQLATIHGVTDSSELSFLRREEFGLGATPSVLDTALSEDRIREALASAPSLAGRNAPVLLHGDYWPGNILWRDGELVAVVDWEDASVGDPLADLGNTRLEILWAFGVDAMNDFTHCYRALTTVDLTDLPYWDLRAALRPCSKLAGWGLDAATEHRMRELHGRFVTAAIDDLPQAARH